MLKTVLKNLHPLTHLLFLSCIIAHILKANIVALLILFCVGLIINFLLNIKTEVIIKELNTLFLGFVFLFPFSAFYLSENQILFSTSNAIAICIFFIRMGASLFYCKVFYTCINFDSLRHELDNLFSCTKIKALSHAGTLLSYSARLIPKVIEEYTNIKNARKLRSCKKKENFLTSSLAPIAPLIEGMLFNAYTTEQALKLRTLSPYKSKMKIKIKFLDYIFFSTSAILLLTAFLYA